MKVLKTVNLFLYAKILRAKETEFVVTPEYESKTKFVSMAKTVLPTCQYIKSVLFLLITDTAVQTEASKDKMFPKIRIIGIYLFPLNNHQEYHNGTL